MTDAIRDGQLPTKGELRSTLQRMRDDPNVQAQMALDAAWRCYAGANVRGSNNRIAEQRAAFEAGWKAANDRAADHEEED